MATLISSQSFRCDATVLAKIAAGDFEVQVSPVFVIDGEEFRVILDGHHSYEAAVEAGHDPEFVEQSATDNDMVAVLENGDVDTFLQMAWVDCDYYNVSTGHSAF